MFDNEHYLSNESYCMQITWGYGQIQKGVTEKTGEIPGNIILKVSK